MSMTKGKTDFKKGKAFTEEIANIAQIPGGLEMLVTMAAEELGGPQGGKSKQLRLYNMGGRAGYANGGLAQAAEMTRQGGRNDDEVLLHVSPEEFEALTGMWGQPDTNPNTGLPEYGFLSKVWKKVKNGVKKIVKSPLFSMLAPIALNVFAPGLGTAIGGWLGATGKAAATIGNTLIRTGIGAASGGKEGAISGALSGLTSSGVGADIGKKIGLEGTAGKVAGDALLGGVAGEGTGVGFQQGALGQGLASLAGNPMQKAEQRMTDAGRSMFNPEAPPLGEITPGSMTLDPSVQDPFGYGEQLLPQTTNSGAVLSEGATAAADPSMWDRATGWMKEHPYLTAGGALAAGALISGGGGSRDSGPPGLPDSFTTSLPNLSFNRNAMPIEDYYNYGRTSAENPGEQSFFDQNSINAGNAPLGGGGRGGGGGSNDGRGHGNQGRRGEYRGYIPPPGNVGNSTGGSQPGAQPIAQADGMARVVQQVEMQGAGYTFDPQTGMYYPPGWFGLNGAGPVQAAHGGYVAEYALGGLIRKYKGGGHVRGAGTGRSDDIPAVLSDGEYVIDSETVALLGDGSTDAGAKRLDEMRAKLRKHKGKKLAKGGFSDAAKSPEAYMAEGGDIKKNVTSKIPKSDKPALKDLKRMANRLAQAVEGGDKKRIKEITANLESMSGGDAVLTGFAKGGTVQRIISELERTINTEHRSSNEGPLQRKLKDRRDTERKSGSRRKVTMTDEEKAALAQELGGFKPDAAFIKRFKKDLAKAKAKEKT